MIERTDEGSVPAGRMRRVAVVFEVCCGRCSDRETITASGFRAAWSPMYDRGWRTRAGRWSCPRCSGGRQTHPLRLVTHVPDLPLRSPSTPETP